MEATIDVVEDKGQKVISTRWVLTEKEYPDGEIKPKARLVICGFEEEEEKIQTDAPTVAKTTLRIVLAIAANVDLPVQTIDIKAAFLPGRPIQRDVYIVPPVEANVAGKLWRLRKTAYGLIDAARNWYLSVKVTLVELKVNNLIWTKQYSMVQQQQIGRNHLASCRSFFSDWVK